MKESERFNRAVTQFDRLNAQDPNHRMVDGEPVPFELFFSNRMTEWVTRLNPDAPEPVGLAARCQHLCRWEIPRTEYPDGRAGYLAWRKRLKYFHADRSAEVLRECGYDEVTVERVRSINLKKGLGRDADVQVIEDALCLVFLESQIDDLINKTDADKMVSILRKTWAKMSDQAKREALDVNLSERAKSLLKSALEG